MDALELGSQYALKATAGSVRRMGLIASYDLSIVVEKQTRIEIGRFSLSALPALRLFSKQEDDTFGPIISVGSFCEFAQNASVIVGGEHYNDHLFNVTLGGQGDFFRAFMATEDWKLCGSRPSKGITVGDGVVASTNSIILDGSNISAGCVIGAGSALKGATQPFGVYAGMPARFIRGRLSENDQRKYQEIEFSRVAAHVIPFLPSTALAYQQGRISASEMRHRLPLISARPCLHASAVLNPDKSIGVLTINSFAIGAETIKNPVTVERLHRYFNQANTADDTVQWVPDVFLAMGLIDLVTSEARPSSPRLKKPSEMQFALLNAPGVYSVDKQLMGRQAAGAGFLRAALNARPDRLFCYAESHAAAETFGKLAQELGPLPREMHYVNFLQPKKLAAAGILFRPDPGIGENAWERQALAEARGHSICGITHTLSSQNVYSAVCELLRAPLYPWDAVICTSSVAKDVMRKLFDTEAEHLRSRFGANRMSEPHLATIPLGVHRGDFAFSDELRAASRVKIGVTADEVVVLFAGRLVFHAKGHPMPMFAGLQRAAERSGQRVRLVLFGQFPNAAIGKAFADEARRFAPNVALTILDGAIPENRDVAWSVADVFTSFSDNVQETFGLTPVEAMAAGLPVVVSDWNGYKDTVRDGIDGFRVPTFAMSPGSAGDLADRQDMRIDNYDFHVGGLAQFVAVDIEAAAEAFAKLIASPELRRRMGEAGRDRARTVFDWAVVFRQYLALWDELAEIRKTAPPQPGEKRTARRPDRPDPSSLFASFPTASLDDDTWVQIDPAPTADIATLRALASTSFAAAVLPPAEAMTALLEAVRAQGALRFGDLAMACPALPRNVSVRAVLWLAKMGVLSLRSGRNVGIA